MKKILLSLLLISCFGVFAQDVFKATAKPGTDETTHRPYNDWVTRPVAIFTTAAKTSTCHAGLLVAASSLYSSTLTRYYLGFTIKNDCGFSYMNGTKRVNLIITLKNNATVKSTIIADGRGYEAPSMVKSAWICYKLRQPDLQLLLTQPVKTIEIVQVQQPDEKIFKYDITPDKQDYIMRTLKLIVDK